MTKQSPPVPEVPLASKETETAGAIEDADEDDGESVEALIAEGSRISEELVTDAVVENVHEVHVNANAGPLAVSFSADYQLAPPAIPIGDAATLAQQNLLCDVHPSQASSGPAVATQVRPPVQQPPSDFTLTMLAIALAIAILALIVHKLMKSRGIPNSVDSMPPKKVLYL